MNVTCDFRLTGFLLAVTWVAVSLPTMAADYPTTDGPELIATQLQPAKPIPPAKPAQPVKLNMESVTAFDMWTEPEEPLQPVAVTEPAEWSNCFCNEVTCDAGCGRSLWAQADMLVWWMKGNQVPALVTTSPDETLQAQAGVLGQPDTTILHGNGGLDDNHRFGARATLGYWLDDCQCNAAEVTWFSLGDGANSGNFFARSVGTPLSPILARPFFNVDLDQQDAELVAFPGLSEGSVEVLTSSEMHSVAALLRRNLRQSHDSRLDFVGGYRYLRYREGLTVDQHLVSPGGGLIPVGAQLDVWDSFSADNDFHGGEIGLSASMDRGRWSLDALAKVAFGNMHQTIAIDGSTVSTDSSGMSTTTNEGFLALPSNIGTYEKNEFAMIPELNLNMRYHLNCRTSLTMGYSLLWITNIARSGDQIDTSLNLNQLSRNGGSDGNRPIALMNDTSMWAQGLNLGLTWEY